MRSISVLTGAVESVAGQGGEAEASPDGRQILLVTDGSRQVTIAGSRGESPRPVFRAPEGQIFASVHWLPDGRRIGYLRGVDNAPDAWIETRDLTGGEAHPILEANVWSVAFAPDGRVFYTTRDGEPQQSVSLWSVPTDPRTGERSGGPALLARWPGLVAAEPLTISADGRRIGLTKLSSQSDVYLFALDSQANAVAETRQLTTDTQVDWPAQWAPDGKSFLFVSGRTGSMHAFRQPLGTETPQPIGTGELPVRSPQITPDGRWIVYVEMSYQPARARVMRVPIDGGPAEQVMPLSSVVATASLQFFPAVPGAGGTGASTFPEIRCGSTAGGSCAIAELRDAGTEFELAVSAFDPLTGRVRPLATTKPASGMTFWDVSPDGATVAVGTFAWDAGDQISLIQSGTGDVRVVRVKDFKGIHDVAWAADGRSLFAAIGTLHGGELLHVMLDGRATLLRRFQSQDVFLPRPSPDGRSLLLGVQQNNSNAWVIER